MTTRHRTTRGQQAVWFADQAIGETGAYNVTVTFDIEGPVPPAQIDEACRRLLDATPALRIRMGIDSHGDIVQWFSPAPVPVEWVHSTGTSRDSSVRQVISRPFAADGGVLSRFVAVQTCELRTILLVVGHHAVMDGVTQAIIAERFLECLHATARGTSTQDYLDLVGRVRQAEDRAETADVDYWLARLDAVSTPMADPVSGRGGTIRALLPSDQLAESRRIAGQLDVSLFTVLLATVHQQLETPVTVVCSAASVRPQDGTHARTAGCFVNQIPLTAQHEPGEPLTELVRRESPRWREDMRRRFLPVMMIGNAIRTRQDVPARLDQIISSYRSPQGTRRWQSGPIQVTAGIFNRYYSPKTGLSVRFMWQGQDLEYDIEWSDTHTNAAARLRSRFAGEPA